MDNSTIIALVEAALPEEILNGNYIKPGINMPLKAFLEEVLVNFISEGQTVGQVSKYIKEKILPDVKPVTLNSNTHIDYGPLTNADVQLAQDESETIPPLAPIAEFEEVKAFDAIDRELGKQKIDEFVRNCVGFVSYVRVSPGPEGIVETKEQFLYSKIPFMNKKGEILIGENLKTIDEVYNILLNNAYRSPTLADKTELCLYIADKINDDEVLVSKIDGLNMTTLEYIRDVLPQMMIDATSISVSGKQVSVDIAIDKIAKNQREILDREKAKAEEANLEKFNRTGENPSLISEIRMEVDKEEDAIEVTAEIPIVSSYLLGPEETSAISTLPSDQTYGDIDAYYKKLLSSIKQSIKDTTTEHDLTAKESGKNSFSFEVVAQEALQKIPTFEMQQLINSTSELIGAKRNELIKLYSNKEEYCDAMMIEINSLNRKLEMADSIDAFSEIKSYITRIRIDLVTKGIKEIRVKQALEQLESNFRQVLTHYNLTKNEFEKNKNKVVESLNDRLSIIRRQYAELLYVKDTYSTQSLINSTNMNIETLKAELSVALESHIVTSEEAETYLRDINRLNTLGTANQRMRA